MIPAHIAALIAGTDAEHDYGALWEVTLLIAPKTIVELGTRGGVSTRVMHDAAPDASLTTYDIIDCSAHVPSGVTFICDDVLRTKYTGPAIDLLFIDVDPHAETQTLFILNAWLPHLADRGVVAFHDSITSGVRTAIARHSASHPSWRNFEFGFGNGMRIMWLDPHWDEPLASIYATMPHY